MKEMNFALKKINTDEFATVDLNIVEDNGFEIKLNVSTGFGISEEKHLIACFLDLQYEYENIPFIILKVNCEFEIEENSWNKIVDKSKVKFAKGFLQHLAIITVGTARGILHAKTENTDYNKYFLPTINVSEIITTDQTFPLEKN